MMTQCTPDSMQFSRLKGKKIQADFDGGALTSDAGAVLLREVDKRIGLIDAINDCIPDPRNSFFIAHTQRSMLAQRIIAIAQGDEDLNDHQTFRTSDFDAYNQPGVPNQPARKRPKYFRKRKGD